MKRQRRGSKAARTTDKSLPSGSADGAGLKHAVAGRIMSRILGSDPSDIKNEPRFENPFLLMREAIGARALMLPIDLLDDLLAQGKDIIAPTSIDAVLNCHRDSSAVEVLQDLREALLWTNTRSEESAAEALCQVTARLVERVNGLAERGSLFDAPKRIRKWPINFAPGASDGASKLKDEVALFEALKVGTESLIPANPKSRAGMPRQGKGGWKLETEAAVEAVVLNAQWQIPFHKLRSESKLIATIEYLRPKSTPGFLVSGFETPKGRRLLWPWWLEELPPLSHINPATGVPFLERLDETSLDLFLPVVEGLFVWRAIFDGAVKDLQSRVVDADEGGSSELRTFQHELMGDVLTRVRNTLRALAGKGRRGKAHK